MSGQMSTWLFFFIFDSQEKRNTLYFVIEKPAIEFQTKCLLSFTLLEDTKVNRTKQDNLVLK